MDSKKEIQHVYLVGAKSLGAYGGYETFVYKLTEYHQNKENIKYHVACKANGDGCMDETKFDGVTKINDHEFEFHNAHCFKIDVPQIGPAQAIYYDVAALKACCEHIKENHIPHPISTNPDGKEKKVKNKNQVAGFNNSLDFEKSSLYRKMYADTGKGKARIGGSGDCFRDGISESPEKVGIYEVAFEKKGPKKTKSALQKNL